MRVKRSLALMMCVALTAMLWAVCLPTAALAESNELTINYGSISIGPTTLATGEAGWRATQGSNVRTGTYAEPFRIAGDRSATGNTISISGVGTDAAPMLLELSFVDMKASGTPFILDTAAASNVTMSVLNDCTIQKDDTGEGSAIMVPLASTLTVKGPGKLTVKASNDNGNDDDTRGSAFGGFENTPCGNIIFDGAYVEAYAECGAAIGGCNSNQIATNGGTITVKGGSRITATSIYGAAIGGGGGVPGSEPCNGGNGGTLTIESGTVTATSTHGAAVGGGAGIGVASVGGSGGTLIMHGGILKATSTNGAAIGGGGGVTMGAPATVDLTGYAYQWSKVDDSDASYQIPPFENDNSTGFRGIRPAAALASTATGTTIDFGNVVKGSASTSKTATVTNTGRDPINVAWSPGTGAGDFAFSLSPTPAVATNNGDTVLLNVQPAAAALQVVGLHTASGQLNVTGSGTPQQHGVTVRMNVIDVTTVTVTPATANVYKGDTQNFSAAVTGTGSPAQTVTWRVSGQTSGSTRMDAQPDGSGTLTVGGDETAAALVVTATSTVDATKQGTATVMVTSPSLTITPSGSACFQVGGATENAVFLITATGAALDATHYGSATLDGTPLDLGAVGASGVDGSVENGSIKVIINRAKLNTLAVGTHPLVVTLQGGAFAGQTVTVTLTVMPPSAVPKTGDDWPLTGVALLALLSGCGVALLAFRRRHSRG